MPSIQNESEFLRIKAFSEEVYQNSEAYEFLILQDIQSKEIFKLHNGLREEQFFMVVDLLNLKIIEHGGLEEFGHDGRNFTLKSYFEMIPANGVMSLLTALGKQTFLLSKFDLLGFLKPSYIVQVPMKVKKNDDTLYLVKRSISPWQITKCGKITAYLSHFTVIKTYDFEELNPRIIGIPDDYQTTVMNAFNLNFKQLKNNENLFSPKELLVLETYLDDSKNSKDVALLLKIKIQTLNGYNKSIMQKAKRMFSEDLPVKSARDVAKYLKNNGLFKS